MLLRNVTFNDFFDEIFNKEVFCFGYGIRARAMLENYPQIAEHVIGFIDNDKSKQGENEFKKYKFNVISIEEFLKIDNYNNMVLLITTKFFDEILEQLNNYDKLRDINAYVYPLMEEKEEKYVSNDCRIEKLEVEPIPKIIHYCWFGRGEKRELHKKCINSWKEKCPNYKIIEWNEDNFDININQYVKQAYEMKKYAFVSDYARLYVLYKYGGIYMDTDVEVVKSLDELLYVKGFLGFQTKNYLSAGVIGSIKESKWIKEQMDSYLEEQFLDQNGKEILITNIERITKIFRENNNLICDGNKQKIKNGVVIYPRDFFNPKSILTGEIHLTKNTYAIHHDDCSWLGNNIKERVKKLEKYIKENNL